MLAYNYTQEILNLQDVKIEKVENFEKIQRIHVKLGRKVVNCPRCESQTSKIHDYRVQIVKDCETFGKRTEFILRKRRYICTSCGKSFAEGCNNKITVLKRNAYGYRRFDRFRNRILHIFSHQNAA